MVSSLGLCGNLFSVSSRRASISVVDSRDSRRMGTIRSFRSDGETLIGYTVCHVSAVQWENGRRVRNGHRGERLTAASLFQRSLLHELR